jgi:glyoxylase-like metal-dependent hydrolase (beta-lactamase superfamily II)
MTGLCSLISYLCPMIIHQFYDKGLAHASYAVIRNGKMIAIDPARDPQLYYDFAQLHEADLVGVIETHPHADFVSSHLEIHETTAASWLARYIHMKPLMMVILFTWPTLS